MLTKHLKMTFHASMKAADAEKNRIIQRSSHLVPSMLRLVICRFIGDLDAIVFPVLSCLSYPFSDEANWDLDSKSTSTPLMLLTKRGGDFCRSGLSFAFPYLCPIQCANRASSRVNLVSVTVCSDASCAASILSLEQELHFL
jgi:hypothetical protein